MSDKKTRSRKAPKKTKKPNGHDAAAEGLPVLPKAETRDIQESFRTTPSEHARLMNDAASAGYSSMSRFYRARMGLEG